MKTVARSLWMGASLVVAMSLACCTNNVKNDDATGGDRKTVLVSVAAPAEHAFDRLAISFALTDPSSAPHDVRVEYSSSGPAGPFKAATEALGPPTEGTKALAASAGGTRHTFVWNSFFDLARDGAPVMKDVVIRVSVLEKGAVRAEAHTVPFTIDNRVIATVAGGAPEPGGIGDGGPAKDAAIPDPYDVVVAGDGTIYVADAGSCRIRKFKVGGAITTVAGDGDPGYAGDGAKATAAKLSYSDTEVAVDDRGVIFICDDFNAVVRAVNPVTGIISTVAGGGTGPDGVATATSFVLPSQVKVLPAKGASHELLIPDLGGQTVRRITYEVTSGGDVVKAVTDTVAGTGAPAIAGDGGPATAASLAFPIAVTAHSDGRVYVLDGLGAVVRRFTIGGNITTVAGTGAPGPMGDGGPATAATFGAFGIVIDPRTDFVYLSDGVNHRIRRFKDGGSIETVAGDGAVGEVTAGPALASHLAVPCGLALDPTDGSLIATDFGTRHVLRISPDGKLDIIAGRSLSAARGDGGPAPAAVTWQPEPALGPDGALYVAELRGGRVRRVDARTGTIDTVVGTGIRGYSSAALGRALRESSIGRTPGCAVDASGTKLLLPLLDDGVIVEANLAKDVLERYTADFTGAATGDGGPIARATVLGCTDCVYSPKTGALYVCDQYAAAIRRVDPSGTVTTVAGGGQDPMSEDVPATTAMLVTPGYLAVDRNETVYVTEGLPASRVRRFTIGGKIATVAGVPFTSGYNGDGIPATTAQLNNPLGVAVDADLAVYVSDSQNHRVRRIDSKGVIATVAGNGNAASGPDGVPPIQSSLNYPTRIAIDAHGWLYVGEFVGNRVRRFRVF